MYRNFHAICAKLRGLYYRRKMFWEQFCLLQTWFILTNFDAAYAVSWRMHRGCKSFWNSRLLFRTSLARAAAVNYHSRIAILISPQLPTRPGNQFWIDQSCTVAMMNTYWMHPLSAPALRIRVLTIKMIDHLYVDSINNCYLRVITDTELRCGHF